MISIIITAWEEPEEVDELEEGEELEPEVITARGDEDDDKESE